MTFGFAVRGTTKKQKRKGGGRGKEQGEAGLREARLSAERGVGVKKINKRMRVEEAWEEEIRDNDGGDGGRRKLTNAIKSSKSL